MLVQLQDSEGEELEHNPSGNPELASHSCCAVVQGLHFKRNFVIETTGFLASIESERLVTGPVLCVEGWEREMRKISEVGEQFTSPDTTVFSRKSTLPLSLLTRQWCFA